MTDLKLDIAFWNYDRTRALSDGTVTIEGVEPTFHTARIVTEIFERMVGGGFDVAELGLSYFLRTMDFDDPPFLAIPVFPNRVFRHSAIYVNKGSGIVRPEDLAGKTIGELALYGHDAGVWPKGILADEYGVTPDRCRWIVGGIDFPLKPIRFVPQPHPADVEVTWAAPDRDLGRMLEDGEIDALISADVPRCILEKSPKVGRLFEDYPAVERDYFRRTGIFPIMHTVVVRRKLAAEHPKVVKTTFDAFCAAKDKAADEYVRGITFNNVAQMLPWLTALVERDRDILGQDWWPYGIAANRKAIDTFLRYHFEQGLSKRRMRVEDVFVAELLDT